MLAKRMQGLHPYIPGEQPKDRDYIKLNANENPYPPSPQVSQAIERLIKQSPEKLALYPDPDASNLRKAIADMLNMTGGVLARTKISGQGSSTVCNPDFDDHIPFTVTPDMIYTGNGSDEVLSFVFYAFFDSDRRLVVPEFTYSFYPVYAGFYDIPLDQVPLKEDWSIDKECMTADACTYDSSTIFANPNAPTGKTLTRSEIRQMLLHAPKNRIFVVDEAYVDFGGQSCIPLLSEFENLVIVRTFSKSFCGAGMRLGYIVASPQLVEAVTTVKNSLNHFPIDAVSQVAGIASCHAAAYYAGCAKKIMEEREKFSGFLKSCGWYVIPSATNFVFTRKDGINGETIYQAIKKEGILVRHFSTEGIQNFLRITIGTPEQMDVLSSVIGRL